MTPADEMNCLALRRAKLADPHRLSAAAQQHQQGCESCQNFSRRIDAHEQRILRALEVPIPAGLEDRVLLAVRAKRALPWRAWAMAATVVLSVASGVQMFRPQAAKMDPAQLAIEHVLHEPESFTTYRLADAGEFRNVVAHFGGELVAPLGKVRYIKLCPGPDGTGWHVVIETPKGDLVTLFFIPSNGQRQPSEMAMKGFDARAEPGGRGYYAIVAPDETTLQDFATQVRQSIRWRI